MSRYLPIYFLLPLYLISSGIISCGGGPGGTEDRGVDPASTVVWTSSCLTAGTEAQAVVSVTLEDTAGDPVPGVSVSMIPTAGSMGAVQSSGNLYWAVLTAPASGTGTTKVSITADGVPLTISPVINLEAPFTDKEGGLGGCQADGNLRVTVLDEAGLPVVGARVMVGPAFSSHSFETIFNAGPQGANTGTTGPGGEVAFLDFGSNLVGPLTVSAAATGRKYLTLVDVDASDIVIPLPEIYPSPNTSAFTGKVTGFSSPAGDPIEAAVVLPDLKVSELGTFEIFDLFSEGVCYNAGSIGEQTSPGNLYMPAQCAITAGVCLFNLPEKTYESRPIDNRDHLMTAVQVNTPLSAITANDLEVLFENMTTVSMGAVAVTESTPSALDIGSTHSMANSLTCTVQNAPPESDILCLSLGDWDSGLDPSLEIGEGRLFIMGFGMADTADTTGPVSTGPMGTVADTGVFTDIDYVGAVVASYHSAAKPGIPAGTEFGFSTVFERNGTLFSGSGGSLSFSDFIPIRTMTRNNRQLAVSALPGTDHPDPDYSVIDVKQIVSETYTTCLSGDSTRTLEYTLWTIYAPASAGSLTLPTPPSDWPAGSLGGAISGLVDTSSTPEDDVLVWEWSTVYEGLNPSFSYDSRRMGDMRRYITHLSFNTQDF